MVNQEPTNREILEAINNFSTDVDKRFNNMEERFNGLEGRFDNLEKGQEDIKLRLNNVAYRFEL